LYAEPVLRVGYLVGVKPCVDASRRGQPRDRMDMSMKGSAVYMVMWRESMRENAGEIFTGGKKYTGAAAQAKR